MPQNTFSSKIIHNTLPGLTNSVQIKFVDEVRSFGDGNNSFKDVILEDYTTINLRSNYRLYDTYDLSFDAKNIFFLSELGESMPRREISWRDVVLIELNGEMSA